MRFVQGLMSVHTADDVSLRIHNLKGGAASAQIDVSMRTLACGQPAFSVRAAQQQCPRFQIAHGPLCGCAPDQILPLTQGRLCRRTFQMPGQQDFIVRVENGLFRLTAEKLFRVMYEKLIERVFSCQQNHGGFLPLAAHAPPR